jgi:hypothetical protein
MEVPEQIPIARTDSVHLLCQKATPLTTVDADFC